MFGAGDTGEVLVFDADGTIHAVPEHAGPEQACAQGDFIALLRRLAAEES